MTDDLDFGQWTVPDSWDKINLKTFQEIERFYADTENKTDVREIIHILCGKTIDDVNALPAEFLDIILQKLAFLQSQPEVAEPTNKIKIDGETYQVNFMNKLKTGEYVSFDTVIKNDPHNYAAMMAILCRKEDEVYDSKFEAEVFEDRVKMYENQPVINILPIVQFFFLLFMTLEKHSELYSQVEENVNLIANHISTSQNLGVCRRLYLTWQMARLKKSLKLISNTSQTSSPTLRTLSRKVKQMRKKISSKRT